VVGLPQDQARLAAAASLGFATAFAADPASADVVIECSGSAGGAAACLLAAGRRARYVQVGVFGRDVTVPLDQVFRKELVMSSGFASTPRSWLRALALVERRSVTLEPLVSEVAPLADWQRVFADLRQARGIKVVFDPRL
jgi:L-iditol 2-dehydrogenase